MSPRPGSQDAGALLYGAALPALLAVSALAAAVWGGLARMGLSTPAAPGSLVLGHGPLVANGFFGTIIALERAVALDRAVYLAVPLAAGVGSWAAVLGYPVPGAALVFGAALGLTAIFALLYRRDPAAHHAVMGCGAAAWAVASALLLVHASDGQPSVARIAPWWAAFLVWTIAGERLELSRVLQPGRVRRAIFAAALAAIAGGLTAHTAGWSPGARVAGAGFLTVALWLLTSDVARRTADAGGLTGYIGRTLLGGYIWLAAAGLLQLWFGSTVAGPVYDAQWHAIFVGFVLSMIFAHAPVMIRSFTGWRVAHRGFYELAPIALHLSLAVRLAGDLAGAPTWRLAGGIGNAAALVLFGLFTAFLLER